MPPAALYIQLHVGDPGGDGTDNPAVETGRELVTFAVPGVDGVTGAAKTVTSAAVTWVTVAASETYSHISLWDDPTAGNCWYKGPMVAPVAVGAGSNFSFPAGESLTYN